jgi:hypothetical protein
MSYILDALKKAEQERGSSQLQAVTAGHVDPSPYRYRWWPVVGALTICATAIIGMLLFYPGRGRQAPAPPQTSAVKQPAAILTAKPQPSAPVAATLPEKAVAPHDAAGASAPRPAPVAAKTSPANSTAHEIKTAAPQSEMAPPATEKLQPTVASLKEAAHKMSLTAVLFSDVPSERVAFINGKKYKEGDYVDGYYLIEKILLEGVELSYQGERLFLRP